MKTLICKLDMRSEILMFPMGCGICLDAAKKIFKNITFFENKKYELKYSLKKFKDAIELEFYRDDNWGPDIFTRYYPWAIKIGRESYDLYTPVNKILDTLSPDPTKTFVTIYVKMTEK